MTISHGFIYIRQAECKLNFSTPSHEHRRTGATLYPKRKQICRIFLWLAIWLQNFCSNPEFTCSTRDTASTQDIRAAKGMKMFPLGDGELSGVRLRSFNMASPHTEAHSQLGTNSGASALKDATETPPLGPFAWDKNVSNWGYFKGFKVSNSLKWLKKMRCIILSIPK